MQLTLTELTSENRFSGRYYKSGHFVADEYEEECFFMERFWKTFIDAKKVGKEHKQRFIIQRGFKHQDEWILDDLTFFKRSEAEDMLKGEIEEAEFLGKERLCMDNRERYTHKVVKEGDRYLLGGRN